MAAAELAVVRRLQPLVGPASLQTHLGSAGAKTSAAGAGRGKTSTMLGPASLTWRGLRCRQEQNATADEPENKKKPKDRLDLFPFAQGL